MRLRSHRLSSALLLVALGVGACSDDSGPTEPEETFGTISVRVVTTPGISFDSLVARVVWGLQDVSAPVGSDGIAVVELVGEVEGFGTLTLEPGPDEPVHPSWALLAPGDVSTGTGTVVLAPKSWTITSGEYAGTTVPIDPDLAADSRVMPSFWGYFYPFTQSGFLQTVTDNTQWAGEIRSWPAGSFPLAVAFDRPGSVGELTAEDSVAFWAHVDRMETALGFDAFVPSPIEAMTILPGTRRPENGVLVRIDTTLSVMANTRINRPEPQLYTLSADSRTWSGNRVQYFQVISADLNYGIVEMDRPEFVRDGQLVMHEMMHVLGAGHGCSWGSVSTYCASLVSAVPSAADVAHLAVLSEMRALESEHRTRWGVTSAIFGYRIVTLGQGPIPDLSVIYGPNSTPASWR